MFIYPVWNPSNISRVFVKRHNFKLMITKMIQGCFDISITYRHSVHSAISFYIEKMLICSDDKRTVCFKSNMQRFCMNLRSPRKTATSPQTKDLSRGPPEQIGLSLTFLCKLAVKPQKDEEGMPRKNDKNHFLGLKYRVDQYREKNQRKALPVCLNKN